MVVTKFLSCQGYLPFTWHNQTFQLENQVDRHIPFGKFQTMQCLTLLSLFPFCWGSL